MKFTFDGKTIERGDIDDEEFGEIVRTVAPYSMHMVTGNPEVLYSMYCNVKHIVVHDVPGDIVECGVWRGGMMLMTALILKQLGSLDRKIYLYDTFSGMPKPGDEDLVWTGHSALKTWQHWTDKQTPWAFGGTADEVREVMALSGYPSENFMFVEGMVEDTIPRTVPEQIAVLRLDTDFYSSTYHELVHLYPRLSVRGFLIIDDYGYYQGARKATDQYIAENKLDLFLARVHPSVRMAVKTTPSPPV